MKALVCFRNCSGTLGPSSPEVTLSLRKILVGFHAAYKACLSSSSRIKERLFPPFLGTDQKCSKTPFHSIQIQNKQVFILNSLKCHVSPCATVNNRPFQHVVFTPPRWPKFSSRTPFTHSQFMS